MRWKLWGPMLLGAAIVPALIGYAIAVWLLFPPPEVVGQGVPVPSLRGESEADARQALAAAGLGGIRVMRLPHPDIPEGDVIAQSPLPGQQLRAGTAVRLAVSSGVARVLVPDVTGFQAERARGLLERLGFSVTQMDMESESPQGRVVSTEPGPGTRLPLPAEVRLTVSTGPPLPLTDTLTVGPDTVTVRTDTLGQLSGTSPGAAR